jgi:hypothetical protein
MALAIYAWAHKARARSLTSEATGMSDSASSLLPARRASPGIASDLRHPAITTLVAPKAPLKLVHDLCYHYYHELRQGVLRGRLQDVLRDLPHGGPRSSS